MSALYCSIVESARKTTPTARAHRTAGVRVQNWRFKVDTRLIYDAGGETDTVEIVITEIATGERRTVCSRTLGELWDFLG
jgi:hypothetical protein